jgi:predicted AAA+ superfamily ATPase
LLLDADYLLVGRRGTGKEALVKLAAFFNGLFYRPVKGSIKTTLL